MSVISKIDILNWGKSRLSGTHKSVLKSCGLQNGFVFVRDDSLPVSCFQFKMSSIKQLIVNAIMKVSESNPAFDREGGPTAEEARDNFIKLLLAELFPEDSSVPVVVQPVVAEPAASPGRKKRAPMSDEAKAAMKAKREATIAAKKTTAEPVVVSETEVAPAEPASAESSPGRKKRAPMSDEAKAIMKAKREATIAAKKNVSPPPEVAVVEPTGSNAAAGGVSAPEPVKDKKPRKPKAEKPAEDANLAKVDPTWRKHLKKADKDHAKELEPELLKYLNAFSKDAFNAKKSEEHVADFVASRVSKAAESDGKVEADLNVVEFEGKEYFVNPETKRVYVGEGTCDEDGQWTNYKGVGYVGMAAFADMTVDDE
jgi:hypothetical protein